MSCSKILQAVGAVMLALWPGWQRLAEAQMQSAPPDPPEKPVWQWIMVVIFVALIAGMAFWNPKRSHQA